MVTVEEKKQFIEWFLENYNLRRREGKWILNYLHQHEDLLANTHFVEKVQYTPKGLMLSTYCADDVAVRYYKEQVVTTDPEKAFHDIRLNRETPLYIQLNFKNKMQCAKYVGILEENPYEALSLSSEDYEEIDGLIAKSLKDFRLKQIMKQIDKALEKGDRESFIKLSEEYVNLKNQKESSTELFTLK